MRQSILVGEPVYTSIPDDILVVVHVNTVESDRWWASPSNSWLDGTVSKKNDWLLSHERDKLSAAAKLDILKKKNIDTTNRWLSVNVR